MKISVISNSSISLPAMLDLIKQGKVSSVVVYERDQDFIQQAELISKIHNVTFVTVNKETYQSRLEELYKKTVPDFVLVITFPHKFEKNLLEIPRLGFINVHLAPLPEYKGADPVFWQIANGETKTKIIFHKMDEAIDSGPIVLEETFDINPDDVYGLHINRMAQQIVPMADTLFKNLLNNSGAFQLIDQSTESSKTYSKPTFDDLVINWDEMTSEQIVNLVRAANPFYGGAKTVINGLMMSITDVEIANVTNSEINKPGSIVYIDQQNGAFVLCKDYKYLRINAISCELGVYSTFKLYRLGISVGDKFKSLSPEVLDEIEN